MEQRKIIDELIDVRIEFENQFNLKITFKNIKEAKGIEDNDEVVGIDKRSGFAPAWGGDSADDQQYYCYPVIVVKRPRPETDEEYFKRKQKEENESRQKEEKERLDYLRLKAKFEGS